MVVSATDTSKTALQLVELQKQRLFKDKISTSTYSMKGPGAPFRYFTDDGGGGGGGDPRDFFGFEILAKRDSCMYE